jgi:tetratricopeptide (TPR) repeat protein
MEAEVRPKGWIRSGQVLDLSAQIRAREGIARRENARENLQIAANWKHAGLLHMLRGNADGINQAISYFTRAIEVDASNAEAYKIRSRAWKRMDETEKAIADLTNAVRLDDRDDDSNELRRLEDGRINELVKQERIDEAIAVQTRQLARDPRASDFAYRAKLWGQKDNWKEAAADLSEAIRLDPKNVEFLAFRSDARKAAGDFDGAIADITQLLEIDPNLRTARMYAVRSALWGEKESWDKAEADLSEAIRLEPNNAEYFEVRADVREEAGDIEGAIEDLTRMMEIKPEGRTAFDYFNRALLWEKQDKWKEAAGDYAKALELDPDDEDYRRWRIEALEKAGDFSTAIEELTREVNRSPEEIGFLKTRGDLWRAKGDLDAAAADYRRYIEGAQPSDRAGRARSIGEAWIEAKQFERAVGFFDAVIRLQPADANFAPLYRLRGNAKLQLKDDAGAMADYDKAVELDPTEFRPAWLVDFYKNRNLPENALSYLSYLVAKKPTVARYWRERANFYAGEDQLEAALPDYSQAISLADNAERPELYVDRASAFWKQGNADEAVADLKRVLEDHPEHERAVGLGVEILVAQEKAEQALALVERAIAAKADNPDLFRRRAERWRAAGDTDKALADYAKMVEVAPADAKRKYELQRIDGLIGLGKEQLAITALTALLKEEPENIELLKKRIAAWEHANDWLTAVADASQIVRLKPDDHDSYVTRGDVWFAKKDWEKSVEDFTQAIRLAPDQMNGFWARGDALAKLGRWREAVADLERAIAIDARSASVQRLFSWILSTAPDDQVRDGQRAVELARSAIKLRGEKGCAYTDTLAAALAETGQFDAAVQSQREAILLKESEIRRSLDAKDAAEAGKELEEMQERLRLYEQSQPYRSDRPRN